MKKLFIFDIDGVLSANTFFVNGKSKSCIGNKDKWTEYSALHENCYGLCKPLACVQEFIEYITSHGGICYALTTDTNSYSLESKITFVKEHYPQIKKVVSVSEDARKIDMIKYIVMNENTCIENCVLFEDTLATIVASHEAGIDAWHITNIVYIEETGSKWDYFIGKDEELE